MALSPEELVAVASLGGAAIGALPGVLAAASIDRRYARRAFEWFRFFHCLAFSSRSIMPLMSIPTESIRSARVSTVVSSSTVSISASANASTI